MASSRPSAMSSAHQLRSERETAALIDCWQDRLDDLRRKKRNAAVYTEIAQVLRTNGYERMTAEVRHKIGNLSQVTTHLADAGLERTVLPGIIMLWLSAENMAPLNGHYGHSISIENARVAPDVSILLENFNADRLQLGSKMPV